MSADTFAPKSAYYATGKISSPKNSIGNLNMVTLLHEKNHLKILPKSPLEKRVLSWKQKMVRTEPKLKLKEVPLK